MPDAYGPRVGTTIAVINGNERLVFEVSYPESRQQQLRPISDRIIKSLKFGESSEVTLASGS